MKAGRRGQLRLAGTQPGALVGAVDAPTPGESLPSGVVVVRGWFLADDLPPAAVALSVDGVIAAVCQPGVPRPDVAAVTGVAAGLRSGWETTVELHAPGPHVLSVHVWPGGETPARAWPPIDVVVFPAPPPDPRLPAGTCDLPGDGAVLDRGVVTVAGWSMGAGTGMHRVDVRCNDLPWQPARLGLPRPDVAAALAEDLDDSGRADALISGYDHQLDLTGLPDSATSVTVSVRTIDAAGQALSLGTRSFELSSPERPAPAGHRSGAAVRSDLCHVSNSGVNLPGTPDDLLSLAVFTHDLGYGGGQLWLTTLLTGMGAGRAFPTVVLAPADGPLRDDLEARGVRVHITGGLPLGDARAFDDRVTELATLLAAARVNAVLVNSMGAFPGVLVAGRLGVPAVWAVHESFTPTTFLAAAYPSGYVAPAVASSLHRAVREADALVFEAEATRQQYAPFAGEDRTLLVRYGIETDDIERYAARVSTRAARAALGLPVEARLLVVVGTTEPRKAQTLIAQAFAQVMDEHPDTLLVLVGCLPGDYGDTLARYVDERGLADRVVLSPVVSDIYPWYRSADLLVSASDVESLPRSLLEAMAFGVPVLATDVFGVGELLTDGVTGYLLPPRDLSALVAGLRRVLDLPPAALRATADAGRAHVVRHYAADGYATDLYAVLAGLRGNRAAVPGALVASR